MTIIFYSLIFKESSTSQVCVLSCSYFYHLVLCLCHRKLKRKCILLHRLFVKFGGDCDVWFATKFNCKSLPFFESNIFKVSYILLYFFVQSVVFKTRSTESLSFPLCFANFATASLWAFYGAMLDDNFILVRFMLIYFLI